MTNGADIIAICVIGAICAGGGLYIASQPVTLTRRDRLEKALLEKLERENAVARQDLAALDIVAVLDDIPAKNLLKGQTGTIVRVVSSGVFLVEFAGREDGEPSPTEAVDASTLLKLVDARPSVRHQKAIQ